MCCCAGFLPVDVDLVEGTTRGGNISGPHWTLMLYVGCDTPLCEESLAGGFFIESLVRFTESELFAFVFLFFLQVCLCVVGWRVLV